MSDVTVAHFSSQPGALLAFYFLSPLRQHLDQEREGEQVKEVVLGRHASRQKLFTKDRVLATSNRTLTDTGSSMGHDGLQESRLSARGRDGKRKLRLRYGRRNGRHRWKWRP